MYTKTDLIECFRRIGIKPNDTLLVHSSMKAIGEVDGGAETVLDALIDYMNQGLLILPTHTWSSITAENNVYDREREPSCVGILSNLFLKRPGVIRSLHPTHSVAALGVDVEAYIEGDEQWDTPCPREGCWGKLYDRRAKILFLGCSLKKNTYLHGVEEWNDIPNRLTDSHQAFYIRMPNGELYDRPMRRHCGGVWENYDKMKEPFLFTGIAKKAMIGDAESILCDAVGMADLTSAYLQRNQDLFADNLPIPLDWYQ